METISTEAVLNPDIDCRVVFFGESSAKIACGDIHPVFPLVVTADRSGHVVLWDYSSHQVVLEFSIKQLDDATQRTNFQIMHLKKDIKGYRPLEEKLGVIVAVRFLDNECLRSRALMEKWRQQWHGSSAPDNVQPRWIVLVTETRTIFYNYITFRHADVRSQPHLDGKPVTSFDYFPLGALQPWAAFGCGDGTVRIINYIQIWDKTATTVKIERKVACPQRSPIMSLLTFQRAKPANAASANNMQDEDKEGVLRDADLPGLITGSQDGTVIIWDVLGPSQLMIFPKHHNGDAILSMTYCSRLGIFSTIGGDKTISSIDLNSTSTPNTNPELSRLKITGKRLFSHIQAMGSHPLFKTSALLLCEKGPKVFAVSGRSPTLLELIDLSSHLSLSKIKIYEMVHSAANPAFVLCCTNLGACVISIDRFRQQPQVDLLGQVLVYSDDDHIIMDQIDIRSQNQWGRELERNRAFQIKKNIFCFTPDLALSRSGLFLSLFWRQSSEYAIVEIPTGAIVEEGAAVSFAWGDGNASMDLYAIAPPFKHNDGGGNTKTRRKSFTSSLGRSHGIHVQASLNKAGGLMASTAAANAAAAAAAAAATPLDGECACVVMRAINIASKKATPIQKLNLHRQPTAIFGGAMLSIVYGQYSFSAAALQSSGTAGSLQAPGGIGDASSVSSAGSSASMRVPGSAGVTSQSLQHDEGGDSLASRFFNKKGQTHASLTPAAAAAAAAAIVAATAAAANAAASSNNNNNMNNNFATTVQFVPWTYMPTDNPTIINTSLPPPVNIFWEPAQEFCIFVYEREFVVFSAKQKLKFLSRVLLSIASGIWVNQTFFFVTMQSIGCYFPHKQNHSCVLLANVHQGTLSADSDTRSVIGSASAAAHSHSTSSLSSAGMAEGVGNVLTTPGGISVNRRPSGPCRILGLFDKTLVLIDSFYDAHYLTLTNPNLKCRMLISAGVMDKGLGWAQTLVPQQQEDVAIFLYQRGLGLHALMLVKINDWLRCHLEIRERQYTKAFVSVRKLAAMYKEQVVKKKFISNANKDSSNNNNNSGGSNMLNDIHGDDDGDDDDDDEDDDYNSLYGSNHSDGKTKKDNTTTGGDDKSKDGLEAGAGSVEEGKKLKASRFLSAHDLYKVEEDDTNFDYFLESCTKMPVPLRKFDVVRMFILLAERTDDDNLAMEVLMEAATFDKRVYQYIIIKYAQEKNTEVRTNNFTKLINTLVEDGGDYSAGFLAAACVKDIRHMLMALLRSNRHAEAAELASRDPQLARVLPSVTQKWNETLLEKQNVTVTRN